MKYTVEHSVLEKYLQLKVSDQELFPENAPSGTSFYDLQPEGGEAHTVKYEHVANAVEMYMNSATDFNTLSEWIDSVIALDLFRFDDSSDEELDRVAGLVYSLDELKEDKETLDNEVLNNLLEKYRKN